MIRIAACFAAASILAFGQGRAQLAGFVHDSSGALVRDAAVSALNTGTGVRRSTQTNGDGFYAISSLTPGSWKVSVRKPGFQTVARTGVDLHATDAARLDFVLEVGSVYEEITVVAVSPLINTTDASRGISTGRAPAGDLPVNGRGLQALIDLAPGVLTTPATGGEAGQFSANGQRPAANYFSVDGVSANNGVSGSGLPGQFSGGALPSMTAIGSLHNLVALGELDELRVLTSTFAPEFGRLPGAQISVSTRPGSNTLHGELFGSMRHERGTAQDPFATEARLGRIPNRLFDGGATISGPIQRDRMFFLVSTEHIRLRQPFTFLTVTPTAADRAAAAPHTRALVNAFPQSQVAHFSAPSSVDTTSVRIDRGTMFVRYNRAPSSNTSGYLQRNRADFTSSSFVAGVATVVGSRVTNDARLGRSTTSVDSFWLPGAASIDIRTLLPPPGAGQRLWGIGVRGVGQLFAGDPGYSRQTQWTLTDTIAFATGRHEIRAGIDYQRLSPQRERPIATVTAVYDSLEHLVQGAIPAYTFAQTGGGSSTLETLSLFVQDTWHVTPRLNITYGIRQEVTPAPSFRGAPASEFVTTVSPNAPVAVPAPVNALTYTVSPVWPTRANQIAPRVGAAWSVTDNTVLRAGVGLFYDLGFSSAVDLVNGAPYNRWRNTFGTTAMATPEDTVQYGFAPNLRLPRTTQWNVTLERGLGRDSAVSAAWVGSHGNGLLRREGTRSLVLATNNGESSYQSMQLVWRSRTVAGIQGTVSYTWAHAIDNGSWDSAVYLLFPGATDRGSANFDVRHSLQAAVSRQIGRKWTVSGILRSRTGFPIDVTTTNHPFGFGFDNEVRPDLVPGAPIWLPGRRLNPAAFAKPEPGRQGSLGRNAIRGNGLTQIDLAVSREFVLGERLRLGFRSELYNALNTRNFGDPVRLLDNPLFGQSQSLANLMLGSGRPNSGLTPAFQSGGSRTLQAGFTLRF